MSYDTPANHGADRNLLFGILALQMDFISRDALLEAMNAWVLNKGKSLGQILVEKGQLGVDRQTLLDALVAQHLQKNDVGGLATVGPATAMQMGGTANEGFFSLASRTPTPPPPDHPSGFGQATSGGKRFHVLRPHARGGLGTVSIAHDEELHREVALKEIHADFANHPESQSRFLLEAEITGRLEHPGIVPVYGLGKHADGRPYYAMRFIKGLSLEEAIKLFHQAEGPNRAPGERALAFRGLLSRFIDVCNAVAYAHSRGIIHRDLKPANVLLGPFGETLVVDWGLAKAMDRPEEIARPADGTLRPHDSGDSNQTKQGAVLGTPAYMSPEQADSQHDRVGPASDVYSLGATLYCLLTGRPPFEGDVATILIRVCTGDFLPPRKVKRNVSATLEAICLKAMATRPEDRYPSARDLADDIEHWQADEPVKAHRETWHGWARRWSRRHRTVVAGAAALLLTTVFALSVGLAVLGRTQQETDKQRLLAEKNAERATKAQADADANAATANAQRSLALEALKSLVVEVQSQLREPEDGGHPLDPAGVRDLRQRLLGTAINGLQRLARGDDTAAEADQNMIRAQLDLGDIMLMAGRSLEARARYEEAHRIAEQMVRTTPKSVEGRRFLCVCLKKLGDWNLQNEKVTQAADAYRQSLQLAEELAGEPGRTREDKRFVYVCLLSVGDLELQRNEVARGSAIYKKALAIATDLAKQGGSLARRDLSVCYSRLGDASMRREDFEAALNAYHKALEMDLREAKQRKGSIQARRDLALTYQNLGNVSLRRGDTEGALWALRKAHDLNEALADPGNVRSLLDLARTHERIASALQQELDLAKAQDRFEQAIEILDQLEKDGKLKYWPRPLQDLARLRELLDEVKAGLRAVNDLDFVLGHPPARAAALLMIRARLQLKKKRVAEAADTAMRLALLGAKDPLRYYDAAVGYALCAGAVAPGKKPSDYTEEEKAEREGYVTKALANLGKSRDADYFKVPGRIKGLEKGADFAALRDDPRFQQFAGGLRQN
jgi:serine/threonine-protein kinase